MTMITFVEFSDKYYFSEIWTQFIRIFFYGPKYVIYSNLVSLAPQ